MTARTEIDAINALDEAVIDALAIVILIREGLEGAGEKGEPIPFEPENLRRVLGVVFDTLKKAEGAADVLSDAYTARVARKSKRA